MFMHGHLFLLPTSRERNGYRAFPCMPFFSEQHQLPQRHEVSLKQSPSEVKHETCLRGDRNGICTEKPLQKALVEQRPARSCFQGVICKGIVTSPSVSADLPHWRWLSFCLSRFSVLFVFLATYPADRTQRPYTPPLFLSTRHLSIAHCGIFSKTR